MFWHHRRVREGWVVPERPANFDSLSEAEQKKIDEDLESETIHKYYEAQVYKRSPRHWDVLSQPTAPTLRKPVWLVSRMWENQDVFFLRQSLISLAKQWDEIFAGNIPCPITFTDEDLKLHAAEEVNTDGVGQMLALFRDQGVLPADGIVHSDDYEAASENSRRFKEVFIGLAQNEAERELYTKLWPYSR
ncbi:hypothetical protein BJX76DRAFT_38146 [Aspergillus varians]